MSLAVDLSQLAKIPYLDTSRLGDRVLYLLPFWDGTRWHLWVPQADGSLFTMHPRDAVRSDYVAKAPASHHDLPIFFLNFIWQRASFPKVHSSLRALLDEFHTLATSVAKVDHFFSQHTHLGFGSSLFVATEVEYMLIRCRSIFDHLQRVVAVLWEHHVRLLDPDRQKRKRLLPESFADVIFERNLPRESARIIEKYQLPRTLSDAYCEIRPFFASIRSTRDRIIHGIGERQTVFHTERGWCVAPDDAAFRVFRDSNIWTDAHRFSDRLVSLRPLMAHLVFGTMSACGELLDAFAKEITFQEPLAPDYTVFVRSVHGGALARLDSVIEGGSPWWNEDADGKGAG